MNKIALGMMLLAVAWASSPLCHAAATKDPGKQIDDHTWQGRITVEQGIAKITENNKVISLKASDKIDDKSKALLADPAKSFNGGKKPPHAKVTGTMSKDKDGGDFIAVDKIEIIADDAAGAGAGGAKGGKKGK
ncbi:MAG: hypothetical protein HY291_01375 [Planctomycetes bacterium]|nr:hypothetical protein [Planctomycetota bacterium]